MVSTQHLEQKAIDAAVNSNWKQAVEYNLEYLKLTPHEIDACLRLGYAYLQLNELASAKKYYKEALRIQPKHNIALENLERIEILESKKKTKTAAKIKYDPNLFLEIPGKTKTIQLVNLGQKEDIAGLSIGQEVQLKEKKRRLEVRTVEGDYIGTLPDDLSKRLLYFIKEESQYTCFIKEIDLTEVIVFIKEVKKGQKVRHYPSFPSNPHVMLTDINQLEEESEADEEKEKDEDDEDGDSDLSDDEHWTEGEEFEEDDEDKEDLDTYVDVEEEDEEEEE
jgi:tetratricopeptide (TPR) repeat protein